MSILQRFILKKLIEWKESKYRKPLILRGARQVGKTYILKQFGKENYEGVAYFNFDHDEALTAKLLLVLEKKLAQRSKVPMGNKMFSHTFTSGFNVNFDKTNKSSNSMKGSSLQKSQSKSNVKGSNVFDEYE